MGNVTHVEKLDPEELPPLHRPRPQVKVEKSQNKSQKAKIKPLRRTVNQRHAQDVNQHGRHLVLSSNNFSFTQPHRTRATGKRATLLLIG